MLVLLFSSFPVLILLLQYRVDFKEVNIIISAKLWIFPHKKSKNDKEKEKGEKM